MSGRPQPLTLSVSKGVSWSNNPPSFLPLSRNPEGTRGMDARVRGQDVFHPAHALRHAQDERNALSRRWA